MGRERGAPEPGESGVREEVRRDRCQHELCNVEQVPVMLREPGVHMHFGTLIGTAEATTLLSMTLHS